MFHFFLKGRSRGILFPKQKETGAHGSAPGEFVLHSYGNFLKR
jgi:hypothetical protein